MYSPNPVSDDLKRYLQDELENIRINITPEDWIYVDGTNAPAFQNSWANLLSGGDPVSPLRFYLDPFERVHIQGVVDTGASGTVIFTLPTGYRPTYQVKIATEATSSGGGHGGHAHILIDTGGDVYGDFSGGGTATELYLDVVSFRL